MRTLTDVFSQASCMAPSPHTAFQLYSVRSHPDSLPELIRRVATRGYDGVEFGTRFQQESAESIAEAVAQTGLTPVAVHADLSTIEAALSGETDLLERCVTVGCPRLIVPHFDAAHLRTADAVQTLAARLEDVATALHERGLELGLHNDRRWLCPLLPSGVETAIGVAPVPNEAATYVQKLGRRIRARTPGTPPHETPFQYLTETAESNDIWIELEVAELLAGGVVPSEGLSSLDDLTKMLHVRDVASGSGIGTYENVPHGDGIVNYDRVFDVATDANVEWFVYENELDMPPEEKIDAGRRFFDRMFGE